MPEDGREGGCGACLTMYRADQELQAPALSYEILRTILSSQSFIAGPCRELSELHVARGFAARRDARPETAQVRRDFRRSAVRSSSCHHDLARAAAESPSRLRCRPAELAGRHTPAAGRPGLCPCMPPISQIRMLMAPQHELLDYMCASLQCNPSGWSAV